MMFLEVSDIPPWRLLLVLVPLAATWFTLRHQSKGLERRLFTGMLRATVQLTALGFVLVPLFELRETALVLLILAAMCALAAFFSLGLLGKGPGLRLWPQAVAAILPLVVGLTAFALGLIIPDRSILDPRLAVSFAGMLAGVSMNSVALAGERFLSGLEERRSELEMSLLLGATSGEACRQLAGASVRVAVTPSLNSLIAVGLVSIPGMMSGQVIAGGDPLVAARYQLLIMALWVTAATLAPSLFLRMLPSRLLPEHRLDGRLQADGHLAFDPEDLPPPPPGSVGSGISETRPQDGCGPQVFGENLAENPDSGRSP